MATTNQLKRTGSLFLSLGILVAAVVVYNVLISGEISAVTELRGELGGKREALAEQRALTNQVNSLIARFKSVAALETTVSMSIPKSEDFAGLLRQINAITRTNTLDARVISFRVVPISSAAPSNISTIQPNIVEVNLQFTGTYGQLKAFLAAIERNVRIMDVVNLKISNTAESRRDSLNVDVTIQAYFSGSGVRI